MVVDSLRAEHYAATKGSFKFTHQTWSQITRRRDEMAPDLEMVGWYHTHPGWGVFLSGMDTFICRHFFARPLDLALVIDPCRDDRGWFCWVDGSAEPQRTSGFHVFTHRHRAAELERLVAAYRDGADPTTAAALSSGGILVQPIVHIHDQRTNWQWPVILGLLVVQLLLMLALWREGAGNSASAEPADDARTQALEEVLTAIAGHKEGDPKLVDRYATLYAKLDDTRLQLEGQTALNKNLQEELKKTTGDLAARTRDLEGARRKLETANTEIDRLTPLANEKWPHPFAAFTWPMWLGVAVGAVALLVIGGAAGWTVRAAVHRDATDRAGRRRSNGNWDAGAEPPGVDFGGSPGGR
jgi:proteasome lid subunit RPN8/RPN11